MSNSIPWAQALNISDQQVQQWKNETPSETPLIYWCLLQGYVPSEGYFKWAKEYYGIAEVNDSFFHTPQIQNTYKQLAQKVEFNDSVLPLSIWENVVFIACTEPIQTHNYPFEVKYVFAKPELIKSTWEALRSHTPEASGPISEPIVNQPPVLSSQNDLQNDSLNISDPVPVTEQATQVLNNLIPDTEQATQVLNNLVPDTEQATQVLNNLVPDIEQATEVLESTISTTEQATEVTDDSMSITVTQAIDSSSLNGLKNLNTTSDSSAPLESKATQAENHSDKPIQESSTTEENTPGTPSTKTLIFEPIDFNATTSDDYVQTPDGLNFDGLKKGVNTNDPFAIMKEEIKTDESQKYAEGRAETSGEVPKGLDMKIEKPPTPEEIQQALIDKLISGEAPESTEDEIKVADPVDVAPAGLSVDLVDTNVKHNHPEKVSLKPQSSTPSNAPLSSQETQEPVSGVSEPVAEQATSEAPITIPSVEVSKLLSPNQTSSAPTQEVAVIPPAKLSDATTLDETLAWYFKELQHHFQSVMFLTYDQNKFNIWKRDNTWTVKDPTSLSVPLNSPSLFRVVARSSMPYHGPINECDTHNQFFGNFLPMAGPPVQVTAVPIVRNGNLWGCLLCTSSSDKNTSETLNFATSTVKMFVESLTDEYVKSA